jgi:hydroxyethylthiazole kinase-like uncharacterized protein yjeF
VRAAHTVEQIRAAERPLLDGGVPLMERASTALAIAASRKLPYVYGARVVLLVGGGNNGADALWAGAWLRRRGVAVAAVLAADPEPQALAAFRAVGGQISTADAIAGADAVVDGLVGIGAKGALRAEAAALAAAANDADGWVIAVDVPSGVDADTGAVQGTAIRADLTVTFGSLKPGLLMAREHIGDLQLVDVGLDLPDAAVRALDPDDVARLLPTSDRVHDKYSRGVVGVAAGSPTYTGAAVLAVTAAVRAGAGMVRFAGAEHAAEQVRTHAPEAVVTEACGADVVDVGRVQAWVLGPGLGTDGVAAETVRAVLRQELPVLVDADALTLAAQHPEWLNRSAPTLLTPHDREFARFGTDVGSDRIGAARQLAARLDVHVLLKGDATVIAAPDGQVLVNETGSPVLATAGSGDVLSGGIGALLAQGLDMLHAAGVGAYLHGRAGVLSAGAATTSASQLVATWQDAVSEARAGHS